jgi:hypothetical protein
MVARSGATSLANVTIAVAFLELKQHKLSIANQPALARRNGLIVYGLLVSSRILYQTPNLQCQVWARGLGQGVMKLRELKTPVL